ncbi:iron ABC transporter permease [Sphaerochaeta sp.]|uniref:ABC transporter permease n=1 Tax=Sphaerochaeta sp. TaxID=1972642 RepID=UPI002584481C|nr:iron ABC transporter permease [Sphaerochaeta sp.]MDD3057792.1 iron ABC transporter permease [Sphaerochaeta sp.]MDD3457371.1 iron ABC transporter permease [Sphaerochaeta sp.]
MALLTLYPLLSMLQEMFLVHNGIEKTLIGQKKGTFTLFHWNKLFRKGEWSTINFWQPFFNSLWLGLGSAVTGILLGGIVAWLMARTNMRFKKTIGTLFLFPYLMPAWTMALYWLNLNQNSQVGSGVVGLLEGLFGICMPEWFVYGLFPCIMVNGLHFAPFAYILIGGILQNMDATLEESATILKATRFKIVTRITLPIIMPAVLSTFLLIFSSGFASYTVPIFLGGAVRFFTLSSKMKALFNAGYAGQAYIIGSTVILMGAIILYINQRFTGKRRSFTTVTGKSGQISFVNLKKANLPISLTLMAFVSFFSIVPLVVFALQTLLMNAGIYEINNLTLDFWIGRGESAYRNGMVGGILFNKTIWNALKNSLLLAVCAAAFAGTSGLFIGYSVVRHRGTKLARFVESMAFFPYLIPSIAFATIYLAISSSDAFNVLYNSFFLLVIVAGVKYLPFASRGGINSMLQISEEIEEAALVIGVPWYKRLFRILLPIQKTSIMSGYLLPVITCMREVDLFTLLVPNAHFLLTTLLLEFNQTGYDQYANAVTLMVIVIVLAINLLSEKLTGASVAKGIDGGAPIKRK